MATFPPFKHTSPFHPDDLWFPFDFKYFFEFPYGIIEYLLPVNQNEVDATNKLLEEHPEWQLYSGAHMAPYYPPAQSSLQTIEKRHINIGAETIFFVVNNNPSSCQLRNYIRQKMQDKTFCFGKGSFLKAKKLLTELGMSFSIRPILITCPFNHEVAHDETINNNLLVEKTENLGCTDPNVDFKINQINLEDWMENWSCRSCDFDPKTKVLSYDINSKTGVVEFYIPGIQLVATDDTTTVNETQQQKQPEQPAEQVEQAQQNEQPAEQEETSTTEKCHCFLHNPI